MKFVTVVLLGLAAMACLLSSAVVEAQRRNCPVACTLNYDPTCGFNGRCYREFGNECALNAAACNGDGSFRKVSLDQCQGATARRC